ncbi:MAG: beta galactosidase jelly roll domain-containing protein [Chloroflexi bacterium]|nr:beta galactosidase jelly roll domain-containing protein [Chloroflexota bacterium]
MDRWCAVASVSLLTWLALLAPAAASRHAQTTPTPLALSWKKLPSVWMGDQAGPRDAGGYDWHHPLFDDSPWSDVALPDRGLDLSADDRYYRARFAWDGTSSLSMSVASDDGLAVYVNGNLLGAWGNGWRQPGCVNGAATCARSTEIPSQAIPAAMLRPGENVIAVDVWNAATCCFYSLDVTLSTDNPDQALADRFAPYLAFHRDEDYRPIEITLPLRKAVLLNAAGTMTKTQPALDDLISPEWNSPTTSIDLAGRGPGDIRQVYRRAIQPYVLPLVYARIYRAAGAGPVAIQYWFYYYDNPGACNHHEGDWEMMQVVLDERQQPVYTAFAQHNGGSRRRWEDVEQIRVGAEDHPVVYVALGSHASYYKPYFNLLGCFDRPSPVRERIPLPVQLLPADAGGSAGGNWLGFAGRWGAQGPLPCLPVVNDGDDGPRGPVWGSAWPNCDRPNLRPQWRDPLAWSDSLAWDEDATHNRIGKLRVSVPVPIDVQVLELPALKYARWKDGKPDVSIRSAEYFDNAATGRRTILIHEPAPASVYAVTLRHRAPAAGLGAPAASQVLTISLSYPDLQTGVAVSAVYSIAGVWGVSTTATISVYQGSPLQMQIDRGGNGLIDQRQAPDSREQIPVDLIPPGTITDLAVLTATAETVVLTWTAPGDDGMSGQASGYDIRYHMAPLTETTWVSAQSIVHALTPSAAGMREVLTVSNLGAGTYYIAMRSVDDVYQSSTLSNLVRVTVP